MYVGTHVYIVVYYCGSTVVFNRVSDNMAWRPSCDSDNMAWRPSSPSTHRLSSSQAVPLRLARMRGRVRFAETACNH